MSYSKKCQYCNKEVKVTNVSNIKNAMRTHVLNSCSKASDMQKDVWKTMR